MVLFIHTFIRDVHVIPVKPVFTKLVLMKMGSGGWEPRKTMDLDQTWNSRLLRIYVVMHSYHEEILIQYELSPISYKGSSIPP